MVTKSDSNQRKIFTFLETKNYFILPLIIIISPYVPYILTTSGHGSAQDVRPSCRKQIGNTRCTFVDSIQLINVGAAGLSLFRSKLFLMVITTIPCRPKFICSFFWPFRKPRALCDTAFASIRLRSSCVRRWCCRLTIARRFC